MTDIQVYEEAVARVKYIQKTGRSIIILFDRLTDTGHSGMQISQSAYTHAAALINEAIKDMYYDELNSAYSIIHKYKDNL